MTGPAGQLALVAAGCVAGALWLLLPRPARPPGGDRGRRPGGMLLVLVPFAVLALAGLPARWFVLTALAGALAIGVRGMLRRRQRRGDRDRVAAQVLEACEAVAAELSAGSPADRALERARELCPPLGAAVDAGRFGSDVPRALRRAAAQPGAEDLRLVAAAWQVAHRSGQGLAVALDRVVLRLRAEQRTDRVVTAELASARATARLVAVLPAVAWLMGAGVGGSPLAFLVGGPVGWACLAVGLGFTGAGLWWIETLADGVRRR